MARIIVIGGGRMGARHVLAVRQAGHEVAALVDPSPENFAVASDESLRPLHRSSLAEALAHPADAAIIATTADHHMALLDQAMAGGLRRIVVEKPFSQSVEQALRAADAIAASGARVVVNHGRRYDPNTRALKALDRSGRYGRLRAVFLRTGGGGFGCVGTHWIDLCNNLMDALPERVSALTTTPPGANPRGERFDDPGASAFLVYGGGRRAVIDIGDDVGIVAGGEFVFDFAQVSWSVEAGSWRLRRRTEADLARPRSLYGLPLDEEVFPSTPLDVVGAARAALEDALADGPVTSGVAEAIGTMEVFAACRLAAGEARTVALPLTAQARARIYAIP